MFGLSGSHLLVLGIIVLLFGSRRLPELGSSLGLAMRAFKDATEGRLDDGRPSAPPLAHSSGERRTDGV